MKNKFPNIILKNIKNWVKKGIKDKRKDNPGR
jgi:hypothetical protein